MEYPKSGLKYLKKSDLRLLFGEAALIDGWRDSGHTFKGSGEAFARFETYTATYGL